MRKVAQQTSSGTRSVVKGFVYSTAVAALLAAAPAQANDVDEMRAEFQNLLDRMERVEQKQTQSANMAALPTYSRAIKKSYVPEIPGSQRTSWDIRDRYIMPETARGNGVVGGGLPGSFKAPGSDTSVAVHGAANVSAVWNGGQTHVFPTNQSATLVPTDAASGEDGIFDMRVFGGSISVNSLTPTDMGDVGVNLTVSNDAAPPAVNQNLYVSTSWFPTANFTVGNWTLGQQGSALYGVTGGAESVAGLDPLGTFLAPGISYAGGSGGMSYTVGLFAPNSEGFVALAGVNGSQDLPDLHATLSTSMGGLNIGLGGYAREYGITQTGSCPFTTVTNCGGEETKVGFGITAGVSTMMAGNTLNIGVARGSAARGMGNYENWARAEGEQFTVDTTTGSVNGTDHTVVTANIKHSWGGTARSTVGATFQSLNVAETSAAATMNRSAQAIANLFWSPAASVNLGVELNWINVIRKGQNPKESAGLYFKASSSF
jgi:hypothetical protein